MWKPETIQEFILGHEPLLMKSWVDSRGGRLRVLSSIVRQLDDMDLLHLLLTWMETPRQSNVFFQERLQIGKTHYYAIKKRLLSECVTILSHLSAFSSTMMYGVPRRPIIETATPLEIIRHSELSFRGGFGSGKTSIVLNHIYNLNSIYSNVIYMSLSFVYDIDDFMYKFLRLFNLSVSEKEFDVLLSEISGRESLIVFDDCDYTDKEMIYEISTFFRQELNWTIWFVGNQNDDVTRADIVISGLDRTNSIILFESIYGKSHNRPSLIESLYPLDIVRYAHMFKYTKNIELPVINFILDRLSDESKTLIKMMSRCFSPMDYDDIVGYGIELIDSMISYGIIKHTEISNQFYLSKEVRISGSPDTYIDLVNRWIDRLNDERERASKDVSIPGRAWGVERVLSRVRLVNRDVDTILALIDEEQRGNVVERWAFMWFSLDDRVRFDRWSSYMSERMRSLYG